MIPISYSSHSTTQTASKPPPAIPVRRLKIDSLYLASEFGRNSKFEEPVDDSDTDGDSDGAFGGGVSLADYPRAFAQAKFGKSSDFGESNDDSHVDSEFGGGISLASYPRAFAQAVSGKSIHVEERLSVHDNEYDGDSEGESDKSETDLLADRLIDMVNNLVEDSLDNDFSASNCNLVRNLDPKTYDGMLTDTLADRLFDIARDSAEDPMNDKSLPSNDDSNWELDSRSDSNTCCNCDFLNPSAMEFFPKLSIPILAKSFFRVGFLTTAKYLQDETPTHIDLIQISLLLDEADAPAEIWAAWSRYQSTAGSEHDRDLVSGFVDSYFGFGVCG